MKKVTRGESVAWHQAQGNCSAVAVILMVRKGPGGHDKVRQPSPEGAELAGI